MADLMATDPHGRDIQAGQLPICGGGMRVAGARHACRLEDVPAQELGEGRGAYPLQCAQDQGVVGVRVVEALTRSACGRQAGGLLQDLGGAPMAVRLGDEAGQGALGAVTAWGHDRVGKARAVAEQVGQGQVPGQVDAGRRGQPGEVEPGGEIAKRAVQGQQALTGEPGGQGGHEDLADARGVEWLVNGAEGEAGPGRDNQHLGRGQAGCALGGLLVEHGARAWGAGRSRTSAGRGGGKTS